MNTLPIFPPSDGGATMPTSGVRDGIMPTYRVGDGIIPTYRVGDGIMPTELGMASCLPTELGMVSCLPRERVDTEGECVRSSCRPVGGWSGVMCAAAVRMVRSEPLSTCTSAWVFNDDQSHERSDRPRLIIHRTTYYLLLTTYYLLFTAYY